MSFLRWRGLTAACAKPAAGSVAIDFRIHYSRRERNQESVEQVHLGTCSKSNYSTKMMSSTSSGLKSRPLFRCGKGMRIGIPIETAWPC